MWVAAKHHLNQGGGRTYVLRGEFAFSPVGDSGMVARPGSWLTRDVILARFSSLSSSERTREREVALEEEGEREPRKPPSLSPSYDASQLPGYLRSIPNVCLHLLLQLSFLIVVAI